MGRHGKPLKRARYMTERRPGHPTAHADGRVRVHRAVLYDSIGPGGHPCHWCGLVVYWDESPRLVTDHLNRDTWDNRPENLVPACAYCNMHRHTVVYCRNGHERTRENTYIRPDGKGRFCLDCATKARGEGEYKPKRLELNAGGLTLDQVRKFVAETTDMDGDEHVYIGHSSRTDLAS